MTTAHVEPHGPAVEIGDAAVGIVKASVSEQDNNAYLLTDPSTGEQLLVDAADDADALLALVRERGDGTLATVLTTHRHWDHHRALAAVVEATGARVLAGAEDADELPVPVDVRLADGDEIRLGSLVLRAIALRGHTPGSIALAVPMSDGVALLTGDSLFPGGVGKTGSASDFVSLLDDVEALLFDAHPDDTAVHPGHGDSTTLGADRANLQAWRARGW